MNNIWSTYIQKIDTLYSSHSLRFSDMFREKYTDFFDIGSGKKILEIGCGPGALSQALSRWYPDCEITGTDRDTAFIDFAKRQAPHITFAEEDATALSFPDSTFDVTISNTVAEHIEPAKFFGEQRRVLKEGGICLVLSGRKGVNISAPCISEQSDFEADIWNRAEKRFAESLERYSVCQYPMSEAEYPAAMEKYGFRSVSTEYITINLTPDDPVYPSEMAHAMINSNRQNDINAVQLLEDIASDIVTADEVQELMRQVNRKYDRRLELYDNGVKQWDTNVSVTMIIRGLK